MYVRLVRYFFACLFLNAIYQTMYLQRTELPQLM